MVDNRLQQIYTVLPEVPQNITTGGSSTNGYKKYCWGGKMYDVPMNFLLPRGVKLFSGWCLWVKGDPGAVSLDDTGDMVATPIKPFHLFTSASLPKSLYNSYKSSWMPIFKLMEEGNGVKIPSDTQNITSTELKRLYDLGMEHVKK